MKKSKIEKIYAKKYDQAKIKENFVLYESRDGSTISDSPLAIFLYLINNKKYNFLQHFWVVDDNFDSSYFVNIPEYFRDKLKIIRRNSEEYVEYLLTAKYLVTNSTFQSWFTKKEDQIYINTWHGTPLKYMGFDIPFDIQASRNVLRNFVMADYIISPNSHTSKILAESYKLKGVFPGEILEYGYPRVDFTFGSSTIEIKKQLGKFGIELESDKPILLYTPTWKGKVIKNPNMDLNHIITESLYLRKKLEASYQVLIKVHPFIYPYLKNNAEVAHFLIPDSFDANRILSITDFLVTDYSSIFFDYLNTDKPIAFYVWDKDLYSHERGLYLEEKELPGPLFEHIDALIEGINTHDRNIYKEQYQRLKKRINAYDDGHATERVVERIFLGKATSPGKDIDLNSQKIKLLINPGTFISNGITNSFLNLASNIDYEKYDVTILTWPNPKDGIKNILKLPPEVRPFFRFGESIYTKEEEVINDKIKKGRWFKKKSKDAIPMKGWKREANRLVGNLEFDVVIDFSGYSFFAAKFLLGIKAKKHIIFQHNNLKEEVNRKSGKNFPHRYELPALFSVYYLFDKIISVSRETMLLNMKNLSQYIDEKQLGYLENTLNIKQILSEDMTLEPLSNKPIMNIKNKYFIGESDHKNIKVYLNLEDIERGVYKEIDLVSQCSILSVANIKIHDVEYCKVIFDGIYSGWVAREFLGHEQLQGFKHKKISFVATLDTSKNYRIYSQLPIDGKEPIVRSFASFYGKDYVFIDEQVSNGFVTYVHFKDARGKSIGWVTQSALRRFHYLSKISLRYRYLILKARKKAYNYFLTDKIEFVNLYCKIKKPNFVKILNQPKGGRLDFVRIWSDSNENAIFEIREKVYVKGEIWCALFSRENQRLGYVLQSNIELTTYENFKNQSNNEGYNFLSKYFEAPLFNFVNVGRLSPEKNQINLVRAFKIFLEKFPNSQLFIVGDGPLKTDLKECILKEKLDHSVHLLGFQENPFEIVKKCDAFVLPSKYEGQPMVLLEALTLGKKILASNIPGNISVIGEDEKYGLLTKGTDIDDIVTGLIRLRQLERELTKFDYAVYNQYVLTKFDQLIQE